MTKAELGAGCQPRGGSRHLVAGNARLVRGRGRAVPAGVGGAGGGCRVGGFDPDDRARYGPERDKVTIKVNKSDLRTVARMAATTSQRGPHSPSKQMNVCARAACEHSPSRAGLAPRPREGATRAPNAQTRAGEKNCSANARKQMKCHFALGLVLLLDRFVKATSSSTGFRARRATDARLWLVCPVSAPPQHLLSVLPRLSFPASLSALLAPSSAHSRSKGPPTTHPPTP